MEDDIIKYKYFRPRLFDDEIREENVLSSQWKKGLRTLNSSQEDQVLDDASIGSLGDLGQAPTHAFFTGFLPLSQCGLLQSIYTLKMRDTKYAT